MENQKLTMTIAEYSEIFQCSKNLAYRLSRQNKLLVPVLYLGAKRMCVSRKAVLALLEAKKETEKEEKS